MQGTKGKRTSSLRGKGGLVMAAILVVLGIVIWVDRQHGRPREPDSAPQTTDFVGLLRPDDVRRLEVRRTATPFTLEKQGDHWRVTAPVRAPATDQRISDDLRTLLEAGIGQQYLPERVPQSQLKKYQLDKPVVEYVLNGGDAVIQIGGPERLNAGLYARETHDQRVFVMPTTAAEIFKSKRADDYRDRRVLPIDDSERVSQVSVDGPKGKVALERRGQGEWRMTQPQQTPAERGDVEALLSQLKDTIQASSFVAGGSHDPGKYGLTHPRLTINVTDDKGTHTLVVGAESADKPPKLYAQRHGESDVMVLEPSAFAALNQGPNEFQSRTMLSFETSRVEKVSVQAPAGNFEVVKRGSDWWLTRPTSARADSSRVQNLLSALSAPAHRFVEARPGALARYGLANPPVQVTIQLSGEPTLHYFVGSLVPTVVGAEKDYYARTSKSPAIYEVPEYTYQDINVKPDELKAK